MANERYQTLSDVRTMLRDNLDESSASFWTNAQLNRYLNRAKDRVVTRIRAVNDDYFNVTRSSTDGSLTILGESYTASSFALAVGTTDYSLPPDMLEMKLVEVITSGYEDVVFTARDMASWDFRTLLSLTQNQSPGEFYFDIYGEPVKWRVVPKSSVALDLRITYVQQIADMSDDTDVLYMPSSLYLAVVAFAESLALTQDRNLDGAAKSEAAGDKMIAEFFGAHHRQTQDVEIAAGYLENY